MLVSAREEKIIDKCNLTSGIYQLAHFERKSLFVFPKMTDLSFLRDLSSLTILFPKSCLCCAFWTHLSKQGPGVIPINIDYSFSYDFCPYMTQIPY